MIRRMLRRVLDLVDNMLRRVWGIVDKPTSYLVIVDLLWLGFSVWLFRGIDDFSRLSGIETTMVLFGVLLQVFTGMGVTQFNPSRIITVAIFNKKTLLAGFQQRRMDAVQKFDGLLKDLPVDLLDQLLITQQEGRATPVSDQESIESLREALKKLRDDRTSTQRLRREPSWHEVSKDLWQINTYIPPNGSTATARSYATGAIIDLRNTVRQILCVDLKNTWLTAFFSLSFFVGFGIANVVMKFAVGDTLGWAWWRPVGILAGIFIFRRPIYEFLRFQVRRYSEKTRNELDDILVGVITGPIIALGVAWLIFVALGGIPKPFVAQINTGWQDLTETLVSVVVLVVLGTWLVMFLFNRVVLYLLLRWVERTEQQYDDMFARLAQIFGQFLILAVAAGILLGILQPHLGTVAEQNILLPYALVVSVLAAVLGFSTREALENFIGGILLQIDKPFVKGERLVLESGEICDVRGIGMRSTILYNVLDNTEVSVPNNVIIKQKITNVSRPDWQLRIQVSVSRSSEDADLTRMELILLDIAYLDREIDQARITDAEIDPAADTRRRRSVKTELKSLLERSPGITSAGISRIVGGGTAETEYIFAEPGQLTKQPQQSVGVPTTEAQENLIEIFARLNKVVDARKNYKQAAGATGDLQTRLNALADIAESLEWIGDAIFTIGDLYRDVRREMDPLINELGKEPTVHSRLEISEEGRPYVKATLVFYATHLERRFEMTHKVNREIEKRFPEETRRLGGQIGR